MDNFSQLIQTITIWALPVLFGVTLHEVAHGWLANKLGDKTALILGRITLNPFKHIDLVGTILVPILCVTLGGFIFGWAKPVPVDWRNFKNRRRDMAFVALAGPFANLLMALIWACIAKLAIFGLSNELLNFKVFVLMGIAGIQINVMLMIFNLLPIPPLDGSRVMSSLLPVSVAEKYESLERFGLVILILILMFSNVLLMIIKPIYSLIQQAIYGLFSL